MAGPSQNVNKLFLSENICQDTTCCTKCPSFTEQLLLAQVVIIGRLKGEYRTTCTIIWRDNTDDCPASAGQWQQLQTLVSINFSLWFLPMSSAVLLMANVLSDEPHLSISYLFLASSVNLIFDLFATSGSACTENSELSSGAVKQQTGFLPRHISVDKTCSCRSPFYHVSVRLHNFKSLIFPCYKCSCSI